MVKKQMKNVALALILMAATTVGLNAAQKGDNAMTKMADGSYVVNTTTLANDVKGYRSTTPLKITIKKDKVSKAKKTNPDGVTGATMSSDAVKENVKRGLDYYTKHN